MKAGSAGLYVVILYDAYSSARRSTNRAQFPALVHKLLCSQLQYVSASASSCSVRTPPTFCKKGGFRAIGNPPGYAPAFCLCWQGKNITINLHLVENKLQVYEKIQKGHIGIVEKAQETSSDTGVQNAVCLCYY